MSDEDLGPKQADDRQTTNVATDPDAVRHAGTRNVGIGLVVGGAGVVVTFASYDAAVSAGGGKYVIATGAIAIGIWRIALGVAQRGRARRMRESVAGREAPVERQVDAPMVRSALFAGPILACIGIAWTAIAPSNASSAAVLVGLVTAIVATHLFGRRGPPADVNDVL